MRGLSRRASETVIADNPSLAATSRIVTFFFDIVCECGTRKPTRCRIILDRLPGRPIYCLLHYLTSAKEYSIQASGYGWSILWRMLDKHLMQLSADEKLF